MYSAKYERGEIDEEKLDWAKCNACPSCGACSFIGTASTMQIMAEALGLALPGTALMPATSPDLLDFARKAGRQAVRIAQLENMRPSDIVTMDSFENAHDERFQYRRFSSKVLLYRGEKLVYRDNTCYEPDKMPMEGIGMYEGYTHMANLFMPKTNNVDEEKIWQVLDEESEIDGGITHLATGDLVLRIFGYRAQKLQKIAEKSDMLPPLKS